MSLNGIASAPPTATPQPATTQVDRSGQSLQGLAGKLDHALHHARTHNHPQVTVTATPSTGLDTVA